MLSLLSFNPALARTKDAVFSGNVSRRRKRHRELFFNQDRAAIAASRVGS
jgi:hypothetical protein